MQNADTKTKMEALLLSYLYLYIDAGNTLFPWLYYCQSSSSFTVSVSVRLLVLFMSILQTPSQWSNIKTYSLEEYNTIVRSKILHSAGFRTTLLDFIFHGNGECTSWTIRICQNCRLPPKYVPIMPNMSKFAFNYRNKKEYSDNCWRCIGCDEAIDTFSHVKWCVAYDDLRVGLDLTSDKDLVWYVAEVFKRRDKK